MVDFISLQMFSKFSYLQHPDRYFYQNPSLCPIYLNVPEIVFPAKPTSSLLHKNKIYLGFQNQSFLAYDLSMKQVIFSQKITTQQIIPTAIKQIISFSKNILFVVHSSIHCYNDDFVQTQVLKFGSIVQSVFISDNEEVSVICDGQKVSFDINLQRLDTRKCNAMNIVPFNPTHEIVIHSNTSLSVRHTGHVINCIKQRDIAATNDVRSHIIALGENILTSVDLKHGFRDEVRFNRSQIYSNIVCYQNLAFIGTGAPHETGNQAGLLMYDILARHEHWLNLPFRTGPAGILSICGRDILVVGESQAAIISIGFSKFEEHDICIQKGQSETRLDNYKFFRSQWTNDIKNKFHQVQILSQSQYLYIKTDTDVFYVEKCKATNCIDIARAQTPIQHKIMRMSQIIQSQGPRANVSPPPLLKMQALEWMSQ